MGNSELTGNVQNQATINEHYKGTKKVAIYYYDTSNDIPIRVSSSNPLPTTATLSGDITASTEYTEDVASVADPIGGMTMARRRDTLVTNEVSADGDNIALNATNKGQLHVKQTDTVTVDGSGVTQPVSGTVTVTGVSTSAKQDTIIGHVDGIEGLLTTIDADTGNIATEVAGLLTDTELRATPVPVSGTVTATPTGTQNVDVTANTIGLATGTKQDTGNTSLGNIDTKTPALGQALAAASTPVVLTAAQVTTLTPPAAITGFATESTLSTLNGKITAVNTGAVVVSSSALPSGASTAAKQPALGTAGTASADVITVQGVASMTALKVDGSAVTQPVSGTITETNSAAIKTAVETIDNAISGSEMQVDVVGALPAGTNAIGKLAANSGVDIGDVDVTSSVSATLDHGSNLDIDTTAEQITTTSFSAKFGVTVKSAVDNTDTVYIGNSDVTAGTTAATDGFPLEPGESITLPVNNSNLLYAIGATANQKVFWSAV